MSVVFKFQNYELRTWKKGDIEIERFPLPNFSLFEASDDAFTVKAAEKPEEVKALLEIGFEYVCQKDNLIFLRKRK